MNTSATPCSFNVAMSPDGMTPPPKTTMSPRSRLQLLHHPGEEGEVGAGEQRQADGVHVLLQRGLGDLLGCLVQAGVDDFEPGVAQGSRDRLRPTVVAVEPGLGDDRDRAGSRSADPARPAVLLQPSPGTLAPVAEAHLRSPVARRRAGPRRPAVLALLFGFLWLIAVVVTWHGRRGSPHRRRCLRGRPRRPAGRLGGAQRSHPVPEPSGPAGERPVGLVHDGATDFEGWRCSRCDQTGRLTASSR